MYVCLELNAHSLVSILLYLKRENQTHSFMPWIYNSQPCENFFRCVRSLTTVFSRVANCSVKEILERMNKMQLLGDISNDATTNFVFPRKLNSSEQTFGSTEPTLPCKDDIFESIEASKKKAIKDAINIGLLNRNDEAIEIKCSVLPISSTKFERKKWNRDMQNISTYKGQNARLKSITLRQLITVVLKNYASEFRDKEVDSTSSYVEVYGGRNRLILKKSSLVWFLRSEQFKLSSDRLERVQTRR